MNFFFKTFLPYMLVNFQNTESQENLRNQMISVSVNGLVCDFCARSIEKLFSKEESVKSVNIDLEKMVISISLKDEEDLDDQSIKQIITDSGYDVVGIQREN